MSQIQINPAGLPPAPANFAHGIISSEILQVSGQGPLDDNGTVRSDLDIEDQTTLTLEHITRILTAGGATFRDVVMLRVYLTDRAHFAGMNRAFERYVDEHRDGFGPARTTVMVGLPFEGMFVEMDALAVLPQSQGDKND